MRPSLYNFCPAATRTFLSLSVGEALAIELERGKSIEHDLLPDSFRDFVQSLIAELGEYREGPTVESMRANFSAVFADLLQNDLLESDAKPRLAGLVEPWLSGLKPQTLSILRRQPADDRFRLCFIRANAAQFSKQIAKQHGMFDDASEAYLDSQPLLLRYVLLFTRHALRWAIQSGWSNVEASKALNHFLDQDYVLIASFFDELLTKDKETRLAYEELKIMLSTPLADAVNYCNSVLGGNANSGGGPVILPSRMTSPILSLSPDIERCPFLAAPERSPDLNALITSLGITLAFEHDTALTFSAFPKSKQVISPVVGMETLWCVGHFAFVLNQEMSHDSKLGIYQFDSAANARRRGAADLLNCAYDCVRGGRQHFTWPNSLPQPSASPVRASDEHVANELFLISLAWILLHEIGHLSLGHIENSPTSVEDETQADSFATSWLLRDCTDPAIRQKRSLGPIVACLWLYLHELHHRSITTHPHVEDRLYRALQEARLQEDDAAVVTCMGVLQVFAAAAGVHPELNDNHTFLQNAETLLFALRRR